MKKNIIWYALGLGALYFLFKSKGATEDTGATEDKGTADLGNKVNAPVGPVGPVVPFIPAVIVNKIPASNSNTDLFRGSPPTTPEDLMKNKTVYSI